MTSPSGRRVLRFDSPYGAEGYGIALRAMSMKSALRDFLPARHCHPERKRMIPVRIASDKIVSKYRSAGRLPFGIQVYVECLFAWQRSTPLRHFVALFAPVGSVSLNSQSSADSLRIQFPCHLKGRKGRYGISL